MSKFKFKDLDYKTLRKLDDIDCSNHVIANYMYKLIHKHDHLKSVSIDCYVHSGHYTKFVYDQGTYKWFVDKMHSYLSDCTVLTLDSEDLTVDELHKLLVATYDVMCNSLNDNVEFIDTPEDLLAYAEQKLQSLLADNTAAE